MQSLQVQDSKKNMINKYIICVLLALVKNAVPCYLLFIHSYSLFTCKKCSSLVIYLLALVKKAVFVIYSV